tara:strand:- start:40 stop:219 length:180 start_codon:yes stop_codon:yes gene_type:complete
MIEPSYIKMSNGIKIKMKSPQHPNNIPSMNRVTAPVLSTPNCDTLQADMKISKVDIGKE